jgi:hypothetical protein
MNTLRTHLRQHPAWLLYILAPILAEVLTGSTPLNEYLNPLAFVPLMMLYGSGALLARELIIRWQKGWGSLFLLGFAFGIYEEGLVVRSFFDPYWADLDKLGVYGRVAGVNWVWTEQLVLFHAAISIASSIAMIEILLPVQRTKPWLNRPWIQGFHWVSLLLMLPVGKLLNAYDAPDMWVALSWLSIFVLVGLARLIPPHFSSPVLGPVPRPIWFFMAGATGVLLHFILVTLGADAAWYPFPVAMLLMLFNALGVLILVLRWSGNGGRWDDRHRLALVGGELSFFLLFTPLVAGQTYPILYASSLLFFVLLWGLYRQTFRRFTRPNKG